MMTSNQNLNAESLAGMIDHTLLKPDAIPQQVEKLCDEARQYHFASVCVNPTYVPLCADLLKESEVKVCTVIGFPLGATTTAAKVCEAQDALKNGAEELDMVINIGALKAGNDQLVEKDIRAVAEAAHAGGAPLKVIIETVLLDEEEKVRACQIA
jgi:deoxyribose-phosphate aldolase